MAALLPKARPPDRRALLARIGAFCAGPVSGQSLAVFRIAFGLLMLHDVAFMLQAGWLTGFYVERDILFPYFGLEVPPLPAPWLHWLWAACGVCCLLVALGAFYRLAIWGFNAIFIYFFLLDQALYLNHFYMIALFGLLLGFTDAHRLWSVDRRLGRIAGARLVPRWNLLILQFQVEVILIYAGLAKLEIDWLRGEPLRTWMLERTWSPFSDAVRDPLGHARRARSGHPAACRRRAAAALVADARSRVPPLLRLPRRQRAPLQHRRLPLDDDRGDDDPVRCRLALGAGAPGREGRDAAARAPRRRPDRRASLRFAGGPAPPDDAGAAAFRPLGPAALGALALYALAQLWLPVRDGVFEGHVGWTEEGQKFSWRMMLYSAAGEGRFLVVSPDGSARVVDHRAHLDPVQAYIVFTKPEALLHYVGWLKERHSGTGAGAVRIYADVGKSVNGKPWRRLVDPDTDLAALGGMRWFGARALAAPAGVDPGRGRAGARLVSARHRRPVRRDDRRIPGRREGTGERSRRRAGPCRGARR